MKTKQAEPIYPQPIIQSDLWDGHIYSDLESESLSAAVIRNEEDLKSFVMRIPKYRIQKRQPAPPSEDPLLNGRTISFETHMMVVSIRNENMYAVAPIAKIEKEADRLIVYRTKPDLQDIKQYATMAGIGTYHAIVIPRSLLPVHFQTITSP